MQTRNRNTFTTIHTEGALLPVDVLQRIRANDAHLEGLDAESYHLAPGEKLNEAINRSWNRLNGLWAAFQAARGRLGKSDAGTTLTRERWLLPLFQELGFGRLTTTKAVEIEGKSYPISHGWQNIPLHLVGCGLELDKRTPGAAGAARISPHSLLQEYLNRSDEAQWGVVSNGLSLRVLRDNATLTRQAYIEFDLESMLDGEVYSDFILLWLISHQSRFETTEKQTESLLERWSKSAPESGTRALDDLRSGVEAAIVSLGQGFLQHPLNGELRNQLKEGELSAQDYYRQILRLVYRLIFLFAAEDRDLLLLPGAPVEARQRYQNYYSTTRLRSLAERQRGSRHHDRYEALRLIMTLLGSDQGCPELAIPALGGFLFDARSSADLNEAKLDNQSLLDAVRSLAFITKGNIRRAVDYRNLGPEELGSVYESLLELHPLLNTDAGTFQLSSAAGNERKTTGSYYTPSSLIQVLLDSALDPIIEDCVRAHRDVPQIEQALLELKVCDPACGSGHFLIAAAHRIAGKLAEVRAGGNEPSPEETRRALRDVIRHCIYGVDINPMAVELCKVNLWLESLEPGKPLSFLDSHIKCGNSLVGVGPKMELDELEVPDEAFNPVTGDDKAMATFLKKRNKNEREGKEYIVTVLETREDLDRWIKERSRVVEAMSEDSAAEVQAKAQAYAELQESAEYHRQRQIADFWTAAFFWKISQPASKAYQISAPTHGQLRRLRSGSQTQSGLLETVEIINRSIGFFHWPLEFAEVVVKGGFDCILGNPPWERIKLQEEEFFSTIDPEIAAAPSKAARQRLIDLLPKTNPLLWKDFQDAKHAADCTSKFVRMAKRYPLTAVGDVNTYALFAEHARHLTGVKGCAGIIVPTNIATDEMNSGFFGDLIRNRNVGGFFDFKNSEGIFPSVDANQRFALLTITGYPINNPKFCFFVSNVSELSDTQRKIIIPNQLIQIFNPNSSTLSSFWTKKDMDLAEKVYSSIPILIDEHTKKNPWGISFLRMFDMSNDSGLFASDPCQGYLRLYEAKMFHYYNHRFASAGEPKGERRIRGSSDHFTPDQLTNPNVFASCRYYVDSKEVNSRLGQQWSDKQWMIAFRNVGGVVANERTFICSLLPKTGVGNSAPLILLDKPDPILSACLVANLSSIILDYYARQKVGGINLNFFIIKQFPVLPPELYTSGDIDFITQRVLELVYTANDLKPFAEDMGYHGEPFKWDEERRALLRAELDAYYAKLYGLNRDELRYILDPQDVYGPDFPGETFRVLKEKEIRKFGEYRTRRLVLEAWDRLIVEPESVGVQIETAVQLVPNLPVEISTRHPLPDITWIPTAPAPLKIVQNQWTANYRQVVTFAWLLDNFGTDQSIPLFNAQKYSYFLQRENMADLEISYRSFAAGPYSPELTYHAGQLAKKRGFWEVKGKTNVARMRNIRKAVEAANKVIASQEQARQLIAKLAALSQDELGGLATVDFTVCEVYKEGKAITPDNIRAYFILNWPEKVSNSWFTDENINRAFHLLSELGLLKNSAQGISGLDEKTGPDPESTSQPMLSDFGLYKCEVCGKMVMGFEKAKHEREVHGGMSVEWKKLK